MSVLDVQCYASGEVRRNVVISVVIGICLIELSVHLNNLIFPHCCLDSPCCDTVSVHPIDYPLPFFTYFVTVFSRHFRCGNYTSLIHSKASVGNCEQVHTSVLNLIFQPANVAGVGNLSK